MATKADSATTAAVEHAAVIRPYALTYEFANRRPDGTCCLPVPGYSNVLISRDAKKTWNDALFVTADRPFRDRWGFSLAYTLAKGETIGGDLFSFDYPTGRTTRGIRRETTSAIASSRPGSFSSRTISS
jgi:hypothetical protein